MKLIPHRVLAILILVLGVPTAAVAQGLPSQETIQAALRNPGAAGAIRERIRTSGMSPDQIRARLQASGYDPKLLDNYLGAAAADSGGAAPTGDMVSAITALGLPPLEALPEARIDTGLVRGTGRARGEVARQELTTFGVEVFQRTTTQFLPLLSGPVPPDYRVGAGDVLVLILTGEVEQAHTLPVTREGFVLIPQVGQLFVSNLTLAQVRDQLYAKLGRVYSGVRRGANASTQFDISVANVRALQIYVVGEVAQPGAYQVSALGTVLAALYAAGGPTEAANMRNVQVRRNGNLAATFDLYDYLLKGDTRSDLRLENGDVLHVTVRARRATVVGAIHRPARYDVADTETLADLIKAAGGFEPFAATGRLAIERIVPAAARGLGQTQRITINVPLTGGVIPAIPIEDGDSINVDSLDISKERSFVEVRGSVFQPGRLGYTPGMKLSDIVAQAGGLRSTTYAGRAHIERFDDRDSTWSIIRIALPARAGEAWPADSLVHDRDIITFYDRLEMREEQFISISGSVNQPGRFPWRSGMTLRDLVLMAKGTKFGTALDSAEIARLPVDRTRGQLAISLRVPLDSTYLFDRDSLGRPIGPAGQDFRPSGAPEIPLQPFDNVVIFRQPGFELQRIASVYGEVRYPGGYALADRTERLSSLIRRAGGLTREAYPDGIRFYRTNNNVGRIDVNVRRALERPGQRDDLILQPGDSIVIPEYVPTVQVVGAVNSPGSVLWVKGRSLSYYLSSAGGVANTGDGGQTSVRQSNGRIETRHGGFLFFGGGDPTPGPGAEITVPTKEDKPFRDNTATYAALASIIASTATILISVLNK